MPFIWRNAALALPVFTFASASVSPCSSTMLPREVKLVTSSNPSPPIIMEVVLTAGLFLTTLLYPCRPSDQDVLNYLLHLSLGMGEESQVICKVQVIKLGPRSPLNSISL